MDVVSVSPLPVASVLWQRDGSPGWVLTIVCKATFDLAPGESPLAGEQDPPADVDGHWNYEPGRSLHAPSDLAPVKSRADVFLVGSAFAAGGAPRTSLTARMSVGSIDKSIECFPDRVIGADGSVQYGAGFTRMPLFYERAAGGPGTSNPVGVRRDARDGYGRIALPNLQPAGTRLAGRDTVIEPTGFGPIAPRWPQRAEKLGRHAGTWPPAGTEGPPRSVPSDLDFGYFNAAPPDQQVPALRDNERILLENLHREHPILVTTLPGLRPCAFVEGSGAVPTRLAMQIDTLSIDTDRGTCTLTWRRQLPLKRADEPGRVLVALEPPGQTLTWADVEKLAPELPKPAVTVTAPAVPSPVVALPSGPRTAPQTMVFAATGAPSVDNHLPFQSRRPAPEPRPPAPSIPPPVIAPPAMPPPAIAPVMAPPPEVEGEKSPWASGSAPSFARSPGSLIEPARVEPVRVEPARVDPPRVEAPRVEPARVPLPSLADTGRVSAGAGTFAPVVPTASATPPPVPASVVGATETTPQDILELLWFEPESVPRVRRFPAWKPILTALERRPVDRDLDDPALAGEPAEMEDRREVFEVLAHGAPGQASGIDDALDAAVRKDGKFVAQLALFVAELELGFDELETLKATVTTVAPLTLPTDETLKASVDAAKQVLQTADELTPPSVSEGMTTRIREAFATSRRALPETHLVEQTERVLLAHRRYRKRIVFGGDHLRCLARIDGASVPAYLPASLAKKLPMFLRFKTRMIVEVQQQADQYESHHAALRVVALARVTPRRART